MRNNAIDIEHATQCCGCQACSQICPRQCITMKMDAEGFLYPHIEESICIDCGMCRKVCPILCSESEPKEKEPTAYAAINLDERIRLESSSGGVFTLLAEQTLDKGGIVFGAAMTDDQHSVHHIAIETEEGLDKLRGSKYVQSSIGDAYLQVRKALQAGREVLFTGTPCQVEGLHAFLRHDYSNLLCVDLICHGVPSPLVWSTYLTEKEKCADASAKRTLFRDKKFGWKTYAVSLEFSNNSIYQRVFSDDAFMKAFLRNICLRPSCHACHFKKLNRASDITLADFWGIQDQCPDMDDEKGTSLVLVHSVKGQQRMETLHTKVRLKEIPVSQAIQGNPSMLSSAQPNKYRKQFFAHLGKMPFERLVARYCENKRSLKNIGIAWLKKTGMWSAVKKIKN